MKNALRIFPMLTPFPLNKGFAKDTVPELFHTIVFLQYIVYNERSYFFHFVLPSTQKAEVLSSAFCVGFKRFLRKLCSNPYK